MMEHLLPWQQMIGGIYRGDIGGNSSAGIGGTRMVPLPILRATHIYFTEFMLNVSSQGCFQNLPMYRIIRT
jgi:hypothetical protein